MTKKSKPERPFVSVCTPTFNRRPFIENMLQCFRNQNYPRKRIEWIIVDDGTDKIKDVIDKSGITQIKYYPIPKKMNLGAKRNLMHKYAKGDIIVYMDDDDYYPPDRISHAVERLVATPSALCAGSSEIYIYFKGLNRMVQCGPYGPNHSTAGTFAFKRQLLELTRYEDSASLAEERAFLKEYTIPFVQLDPMKTILVFSHEHNTFDKRRMLENPHPDYLKTSTKTVDSFIKYDFERSIKEFFMEDIDKALEAYEPGLPKMKPDVLEQIKKIEAERSEMMQKAQAQQQQNGPIILQQPGQEPVTLSSQDVINIIQQQQQKIKELSIENEMLKTSGTTVNANGELDSLKKRNQTLETMIVQLQKQLIEKTKLVPSTEPVQSTVNTIDSNEVLDEPSKSTPIMDTPLDD